MQFLQLAKRRYSVRAYNNEPVPRELLERALEAARLAPSASNSQPWHFVVVDDPEQCAELGSACRGPAGTFNKFAASVSTFVVILESWGAAHTALAGLLKGRRYSPYDVGMAAEHFCLQAVEDGLGTCMLGWFDEPRVRRIVGAPRGFRPTLVITVGYPRKDSPPAKKRKALSEVVSWNRYGAREKGADGTDDALSSPARQSAPGNPADGADADPAAGRPATLPVAHASGTRRPGPAQ